MPTDVDLDPEDTTAEHVPPVSTELRRPDVPVTLTELAALKSGAIEVIDARWQIVATLRKASIRLTSPEDWLLFKSPEEQGGQVVGYLQDCGADRVRDLWGIEIHSISKPEKIVGNDPAVFHYLITGSGRCKLTRQELEEVEGGRSSTDDFCKGKAGVELELAVRKAARANLDGNITRELSGLKSVPIDELREAWVGTKKVVESCRKGRGFGTRDERVGGRSANAPNVDPPVCPHCGAKGVYRPAKGDRRAFYGCANWEQHKDKKFIVDAEKWIAEHQAKTAAASAAAPLTATDVNFGREPGAEG